MNELTTILARYGLKTDEIPGTARWDEIGLIASSALTDEEKRQKMIQMVWSHMFEGVYFQVDDLEKFISTFILSSNLKKLPEKIFESLFIKYDLKNDFLTFEQKGIRHSDIVKLLGEEQTDEMLQDFDSSYKLRKAFAEGEAIKEAYKKMNEVMKEISKEISQIDFHNLKKDIFEYEFNEQMKVMNAIRKLSI